MLVRSVLRVPPFPSVPSVSGLGTGGTTRKGGTSVNIGKGNTGNRGNTGNMRTENTGYTECFAHSCLLAGSLPTSFKD